MGDDGTNSQIRLSDAAAGWHRVYVRYLVEHIMTHTPGPVRSARLLGMMREKIGSTFDISAHWWIKRGVPGAAQLQHVRYMTRELVGSPIDLDMGLNKYCTPEARTHFEKYVRTEQHLNILEILSQVVGSDEDDDDGGATKSGPNDSTMPKPLPLTKKPSLTRWAEDDMKRRRKMLGRDSREVRECYSLLNLCRAWVSMLLPHCLTKINRVKFGLLRPEDMENLGGKKTLTKNRRLLGIPFIGKDAPSPFAEFAHPDAVIGLTVLAYRYDGLRRDDIMNVMNRLKSKFEREQGPKTHRESYQRWERWKQLANCLHLPRIDRLEPGTDVDIDEVFKCEGMRKLPEMIHAYLHEYVFPECTPHRPAKLSASGVDLGGGLIFGSCFGFSGTPSAMLPTALRPPRIRDMVERGSDAKMIRTLTSTDVTSLETLKQGWKVRDILQWVASHTAPCFNAFIDTGALITGLTNEEVARALLSIGGAGMKNIEVVVFFDDDGKQLFVDRGGGMPAPLSRCGVGKNRRFVFYDQVHTTGTDVKHKLDAVAAVTLGKDMTLRDYTQGCWRMRGIGKGQKIVVLMVDEVKKLVDDVMLPPKSARSSGAAATKSNVDDIAPPVATVGKKSQSMTDKLVGVVSWLVTNSLRSEEMQHLQLLQQNLGNVWRECAVRDLLGSSAPPLPAGDSLEGGIGEGGGAGKVQHPNDLQALRKIIAGAGSTPVVVDFFASWCGPCKQLAPQFEAIAKELPGAIFVKIDADKDSATATAYKISGFPTIKFFVSGNQVDEVGGANAPKIKSVAQKLLANAGPAGAGKKTDGSDDDESNSGASDLPLLTSRFHSVIVGDAMYRALETQREKLKKNRFAKAYAAAKYRWRRMINGKWMDYDMDTSLALEKARSESRDRVSIKLDGEKFHVDLSTQPMKQLNPRRVGEEFVVERLVMKFEDAVRRAKMILESGSASGGSGGKGVVRVTIYKWQVDLGHGNWVDYESKLSALFESAVAKKANAPVPFTFRNNKYVLDMNRKVQQNTSTQNELSVRRVVDEEATKKANSGKGTAGTSAVGEKALAKRAAAKCPMKWQRCVDEDSYWDEMMYGGGGDAGASSKSDDLWADMGDRDSEKIELGYSQQLLSASTASKSRIVLFENVMYRSSAPKGKRVSEVRRMRVDAAFVRKVKEIMRAKPVWEVQLDDGFKAYQRDEQDKLEKAFQSNKPSATVTNAWGTYMVKFSSMQQVKVGSGYSRSVRRKAPIVPTISTDEASSKTADGGRKLPYWFHRVGSEWIPMSGSFNRHLEQSVDRTTGRPCSAKVHLDAQIIVALCPIEISETGQGAKLLRRKSDPDAVKRLERLAARNLSGNASKIRLGEAIVLYKEPVSWEIPNEKPKTIGFVEQLKDSLKKYGAFVVGKDAHELCSNIIAAAQVGRGIEAGPNLNQEKEKEQEQEQEQEKEKEKQKEKVEQPPISADPPPQKWNYSTLKDSKRISAIVRGTSSQFYPAKQLRLVTATRQSNKRAAQWQLNDGGTMPFADDLMISQNWARRYVSGSVRKIKNVRVLLKMAKPGTKNGYAVAILSLLEAQTLRHLMNHKFVAGAGGGRVQECKTVADLNTRMRQAPAGQVVVACFSMHGCGPCKQLAPRLVALASKHPNALFLKTHDTAGANATYGVNGFPQIIYFKGGNILQRPGGGAPPPGAIASVILMHPWAPPTPPSSGAGGAVGGGLLLQTLSGLPLTDPRNVGGTLHSSSSMFEPSRPMSTSDEKILQSARFMNSEVWYNTHELIATLDQMRSATPLDRQTYFEQLQSSRRRIFKSWDGLPVQHLFTQLDSSDLRAQLTLCLKLAKCLCVDIATLEKESKSESRVSPSGRVIHDLLESHDENKSGWLTERDLVRAFTDVEAMPSGALSRDEASLLARITVDQAGQQQNVQGISLKAAASVDSSAPVSPLSLSLKPSMSATKLSLSTSGDSDEGASSVVGRGAAERLLKAMMIQAASQPLPSPSDAATGAVSGVPAFTRTDTKLPSSKTGADDSNSTSQSKRKRSGDDDGEIIRCFVEKHARAAVLAAIKKLREQTKEDWHVNRVHKASTEWGPNGEFMNLSLYCCIGDQCNLRRFVVDFDFNGSVLNVDVL